MLCFVPHFHFSVRRAATWIITVSSGLAVRESLLLKQTIYMKTMECLFLTLHSYAN